MDKKQIDELLTCAICLDRFKQPKQLPCQHTFCLRPCLQGLLENQRICCPECRAVHGLPRTGIDGFPNNLTIDKLIDVPAQGKPSVVTSCQECKKTNCMVGKCFHCEKALCRQCLVKHSNILKDEFNESIAKVSTRIPQLSQKISQIQQIQKGVKQNEKAVMKNIEQWFDRCMTALQAKKKKLLADVRGFSNKESEIICGNREVLEMELTVVKSFCEEAEKQRNRTYASEEITEQQASLIEILEQSKNHIGREVDEVTTEKYAKFCGEEAQSILDSITNFRGIDIAIRPFTPTRGARGATRDAEGETSTRGARGSSSSHISSPAGDTSNPIGRSVENVTAQASLVAQNYRSKGSVKRYFGAEGSDIGCLKYPCGIAVTDDDKIVVADMINNRIQIFDTSGNPVRSFGCGGKGNAEFVRPRGVCVTISGQIVVADTGNKRIQVFDTRGIFITAFGKDKLSFPWSVAANRDGLLLVADDSSSIKVFSLNGDYMRTFGESWLHSLSGLKYIAVTHDNKVIVSVMKQHKIEVFDQSFQFVFEIGTEGESYGQFKDPRCVACDQHGNIISADSGNHRIQVFDKDGNFLSSFGSKGSRPGQMNSPSGVAVLKNGDIVVCDAYNDRIQIF